VPVADDISLHEDSYLLYQKTNQIFIAEVKNDINKSKMQIRDRINILEFFKRK